jgi:nitrite reductase (NADH) small subunit
VYEAASLEDLLEGEPRIVQAERREIVLVLWRGEVFAIPNVCPHMLSTFAQAHVLSVVTGAERLGELTVHNEEPLIQCPWHSWRYSLRSGKCTVDPKLRLRTYKVEVLNGKIWIDLGKDRPEAATASA